MILSIPATVTDLLEKSGVSYETEALDADVLISRLRDMGSQTTQFALLTPLVADGQKFQAIHSANALFNLDVVADRIGHDVRAISKEAIQQIIDRKHLQTLPALPGVTGYETFVDSHLLNAEYIYLHSGVTGQVIKIQSRPFRELFSADNVLELGIEISQTTPNLSSSAQDVENIHNAIRKYTSLRIKQRLSETLEIPPLSATAEKIIKLSANPDADAEELVKIVELDPSLSAQIVGWAASPYYSAPGKIDSIHDAIVRVLGFDLVMNLALGLAIGKSLKIPEECPEGITPFWKQSVYAALTMEKLNRAIPPKQRGTSGLAYLSGLLNNFGYLVLAHVFPAHLSVICRYLEANRHLHHMHTEQHLLGLCRNQMSSQIMETWSLPKEICTSLRFQHAADYNGDHYLYANLCLLTKRLLAEKGIGDIPSELIPAHIYKRLHLSPDDAESVIADVFESSDKIDAMVSIFSAQ